MGCTVTRLWAIRFGNSFRKIGKMYFVYDPTFAVPLDSSSRVRRCNSFIWFSNATAHTRRW